MSKYTLAVHIVPALTVQGPYATFNDYLSKVISDPKMFYRVSEDFKRQLEVLQQQFRKTSINNEYTLESLKFIEHFTEGGLALPFTEIISLSEERAMRLKEILEHEWMKNFPTEYFKVQIEVFAPEDMQKGIVFGAVLKRTFYPGGQNVVYDQIPAVHEESRAETEVMDSLVQSSQEMVDLAKDLDDLMDEMKEMNQGSLGFRVISPEVYLLKAYSGEGLFLFMKEYLTELLAIYRADSDEYPVTKEEREHFKRWCQRFMHARLQEAIHKDLPFTDDNLAEMIKQRAKDARAAIFDER